MSMKTEKSTLAREPPEAPPTGLAKVYKAYHKIFGSQKLGNSLNPADYIYPCDNSEALDAPLEKANAERALRLVLSPLFDNYPPPASHAVGRVKDAKRHREEQTLKNILGKTLPRGRSKSPREEILHRVAKLCWLVWIGVEDIHDYPSLDSIIKSVVLTPSQLRSLSPGQVEGRIKHVRQAFSSNRDRLLRQASTDLRLRPHEQKLIAEIHERLETLKIIRRKT
jgi:hypothetical protein